MSNETTPDAGQAVPPSPFDDRKAIAGRPNGRRRLSWIVAVGLVLSTAAVAGAWLLQSRAEREEADRIATLLKIQPGTSVADVGSGSGEWATDLAGRVGPEGRVFATEVTDTLVRKLQKNTQDLGNVTVVQGTQTSTGLPTDCCDAVLLRLVYHHFADPSAMHADLKRSLRLGGVIAVVDFAPNGSRSPEGVPKSRRGHGIDRELLIQEMVASGFELVERLDDWPGGRDRYCVLFRRPA